MGLLVEMSACPLEQARAALAVRFHCRAGKVWEHSLVAILTWNPADLLAMALEEQ
jgi:hypothetical protein